MTWIAAGALMGWFVTVAVFVYYDDRRDVREYKERQALLNRIQAPEAASVLYMEPEEGEQEELHSVEFDNDQEFADLRHEVEEADQIMREHGPTESQ